MASLVVLMAAMIIFIALIGFVSLSKLNNQLSNITDRALPLSHALESITNVNTQQSLWLYQALLEAEIDNEEQFTIATDNFNELIATIDNQFSTGITQIKTTLDETQSIDDRKVLTSFLEQLKLLRNQHDDYVVLGGNVLFSVTLGDLEEGEKSIQEIEAQTHELNTNITKLNTQVIQFVNDSASVTKKAAKYAKNSIVFSTLLALVLSLLISFLIVRSIMSQLGSDPSELLKITETIADGELKIETVQNITGVYASIRKTVNRLNDTISGIKLSAQDVFNTAEQVSSGNMDLSQRTQEQASSLEEISSSMEQLASTVGQNAVLANTVDQLVIDARSQAEQGGVVASQAVEAMNEINDASKRIADIINVIDDIAFQTNLLALNAAVEAARAGEQGRGFAVVASEVRNLAGRCKTAAREIKELIQDNLNKAEDGTKLVDKSNQALDEIVQSVKKVSDNVGAIASAGIEQSVGIAQVNKSLMQMEEMTQQNASLVEQSAAASASLGQQAKELNNLVDYFKVNDYEDNNQNVVMTEDQEINTERHPRRLITKNQQADWEEF